MSIKIEKTEVVGWEHAIRGMRNPKNSWDRMDSDFCQCLAWDSCPDCRMNTREDEDDTCENYVNNAYVIGPNDHNLMMNLAAGGPVHAKYRRMITVYVDITAPLYWWKEFDTYKVGTTANSCSTMHKIQAKEFEESDFSCEHLMPGSIDVLHWTINQLNHFRNAYNLYDQYKNREVPVSKELDELIQKVSKKDIWWQMIQLLPSSYNQKRTIMLNYEVLAGIYPMRKGHKLDEWYVFCDWIESLPYSEIIIGKKNDERN